MKRRDLINQINKIAKTKGVTPVWTEGGSHTKATIGSTTLTVPRHTEINEETAKAILRQARKA